MLLGALAAFIASVAYLLVGPLDALGSPRPAWARILFYPAMVVGTLTWQHISSAVPVCHAMGVLTMTTLGAALGAVFDVFRAPSASAERR